MRYGRPIHVIRIKWRILYTCTSVHQLYRLSNGGDPSEFRNTFTSTNISYRENFDNGLWLADLMQYGQTSFDNIAR